MDQKTPANNEQKQTDDGKTKVVNYLFKPSGEAVMKGQLVYEKEEKKGLFGRKKTPEEPKPGSHLGSGYYQGPEVEHPEDYVQPPASFKTTVTPGVTPQQTVPTNTVTDVQAQNKNEASGKKVSLLDILLFPFKLIGMLAMGIWKFLGMIQRGCITLIVLAILTALALALLLLYKPPFFWNPIKTWLNNEIDISAITDISADQVYTKINQNGLTLEEVSLNDSEVTRLMRDYTNLDKKCFVMIGTNRMDVYINIDTEERPLWFIVRTVKNDKNKMVVENAGFGRFNTPDFFTSLLNDTVGLVFQFIEKQVTAANHVAVFKEILDTHKLDGNLELTDAQLTTGYLILKFTDHSGDNQQPGQY